MTDRIQPLHRQPMRIEADMVVRNTEAAQSPGERYVVLATIEWERPTPSARGDWFQAEQVGGYFAGQRMWFNTADCPEFFVLEDDEAREQGPPKPSDVLETGDVPDGP